MKLVVGEPLEKGSLRHKLWEHSPLRHGIPVMVPGGPGLTERRTPLLVGICSARGTDASVASWQEWTALWTWRADLLEPSVTKSVLGSCVWLWSSLWNWGAQMSPYSRSCKCWIEQCQCPVVILGVKMCAVSKWMSTYKRMYLDT